MWNDFREFIRRGNVMDMAVGIVIGAAFGAMVKAFVNYIIMPPIGLLLGRVDFQNLMTVLKPGDPAGPYASLEQAQKAGAVVIAWGAFLNSVINFLIIALAIFVAVRYYKRLTERPAPQPAPAEPTTKECPYCHMEIPIQAVRCPYCTADLNA